MRAAALILLSLSLGVAAPAAAASLLPVNVQVASSFLQISDIAPGSTTRTLIAGPSTNGSITWTDSAGGNGSMSISGGNALEVDFAGTPGPGVAEFFCGLCTVDLDFTVPDLGGPTTTVLLLPTFSETAPNEGIVFGGPSYSYSSAIAGASISISLATGPDYVDGSGVTQVAPATLATFIAGDRITLPLDLQTDYYPNLSLPPGAFSSSFGLKIYAVVPEPGSLMLLLAAGIAGAAYSSARPKRSA